MAAMGTDEYSHPDHGEMEWHELDTRKVTLKGWKCTRCHTVAEPEDADEVFDGHDCDQYKDLQESITGSL